MRTTINVTNHNPDTIWNRLAAKLGRQPTNAEAETEVRRILLEAKENARIRSRNNNLREG